MPTLRDADQASQDQIRGQFLDLDILDVCNPAFMKSALGWDASWEKCYRRLWKSIRTNVKKIEANRKMRDAVRVFESQELLLNELIGRKGSNTRTAFVALLAKFDILADFGDQTAQPLSQKAKDVLAELKKIEDK